jgi:hypothetical protein
MNGVTSSLSSFHSSFSPFPSSPLLSSFPSSSLLSLEVVGSALSYLEQRQDWVLNQISQLQERVKNLGDTLGVSPAEVGVLPQVFLSIYVATSVYLLYIRGKGERWE